MNAAEVSVQRSLEALIFDFGSDIIDYLKVDDVTELLVNPDGKLFVDRLSMTNFIDKLQDSQLKDVFMPLSIRGPYGKIFDSLEDNLSFGSWQSFEMSKMIEENSAVISPTLMYIFHRIQQSIADGHAYERAAADCLADH